MEVGRKYSRLAILAAFCGTGVVAGVVAGSLPGLDPPGIKNANAPVEAGRATFTAADVEHVDARHSTSLSDGVSVAGIERGGAAWSERREDFAARHAAHTNRFDRAHLSPRKTTQTKQLAP